MKKLLLVFAFVAVYGVSMAASNSTPVAADEAQITVVADLDDNAVPAIENEKEKEKAKKSKAKASKAKAEGCADAKAEGCADAKAKACSDKPKEACCDSKK